MQVIEQKDEIERLRAQVLLVTHAAPSLLEQKMMHDLNNPFPLLLDSEKSAYRRWGLGETNLAGSVLSPSLNWRYLKLLLRGERFLGTAPGASPPPIRCATTATTSRSRNCSTNSAALRRLCLTVERSGRVIMLMWRRPASPEKVRDQVGLCSDCVHARCVESARKSKFLLCTRSAHDPNFPKYPRLPVTQCSGHEPHESM